MLILTIKLTVDSPVCSAESVGQRWGAAQNVIGQNFHRIAKNTILAAMLIMAYSQSVLLLPLHLDLFALQGCWLVKECKRKRKKKNLFWGPAKKHFAAELGNVDRELPEWEILSTSRRIEQKCSLLRMPPSPRLLISIRKWLQLRAGEAAELQIGSSQAPPPTPLPLPPPPPTAQLPLEPN